jgi:hypothetical protein
MKYISKFRLFENTEAPKRKPTDEMSPDEMRSAIFRFYTPIPLQRMVAAKVIKLIFDYNNVKHPSILKNKNVDFTKFGKEGDNQEHSFLKNKLRFEDYLSSFMGKNINNKTGDTVNRGFDFEGLIAGIFNGKISDKTSSKWDVDFGGRKGKHSIKFLSGQEQNPTLTTIKNIYKEMLGDSYESDTKLYKSDPKKYLKILKELEERGIFEITSSSNIKKYVEVIEEILTKSFEDVEYFTIGYPIVVNEKNKIIIKVISTQSMVKAILYDGDGLRAPKKVKKHELRLNHKIFKDGSEYIKNTFTIDIPETTDEEIKDIYVGPNRQWAEKVFGETWGDKMRTDLINYIKKNKDRIITNMKDFDN